MFIVCQSACRSYSQKFWPHGVISFVLQTFWVKPEEVLKPLPSGIYELVCTRRDRFSCPCPWAEPLVLRLFEQVFLWKLGSAVSHLKTQENVCAKTSQHTSTWNHFCFATLALFTSTVLFFQTNSCSFSHSWSWMPRLLVVQTLPNIITRVRFTQVTSDFCFWVSPSFRYPHKKKSRHCLPLQPTATLLWTTTTQHSIQGHQIFTAASAPQNDVFVCNSLMTSTKVRCLRDMSKSWLWWRGTNASDHTPDCGRLMCEWWSSRSTAPNSWRSNKTNWRKDHSRNRLKKHFCENQCRSLFTASRHFVHGNCTTKVTKFSQVRNDIIQRKFKEKGENWQTMPTPKTTPTRWEWECPANPDITPDCKNTINAHAKRRVRKVFHANNIVSKFWWLLFWKQNFRWSDPFDMKQVPFCPQFSFGYTSPRNWIVSGRTLLQWVLCLQLAFSRGHLP